MQLSFVLPNNECRYLLDDHPMTATLKIYILLSRMDDTPPKNINYGGV